LLKIRDGRSPSLIDSFKSDHCKPAEYLKINIFTVFVVFDIPCLPIQAVLRRELGTRSMLIIAGITMMVALSAALLTRGLGSLFL
jgi:Fe2+ transport system protein B